MSALANLNNISKTVAFSAAPLSTDVDMAIVIPPLPGHQIVILELEAEGSSAATRLHFLAPGWKNKTVLAAASTANGATIDGTATTTTTNVLNGMSAFAANDFVILSLDAHDEIRGGWQLLEIASVGSDASVIDVDTSTAYDGENDPRAAAAIGNTVYFVHAEDIKTITVGDATIQRQLPFAGKVGHPVAMRLEATAATEHFYSGVAGYFKPSV